MNLLTASVSQLVGLTKDRLAPKRREGDARQAGPPVPSANTDLSNNVSTARLLQPSGSTTIDAFFTPADLPSAADQPAPAVAPEKARRKRPARHVPREEREGLKRSGVEGITSSGLSAGPMALIELIDMEASWQLGYAQDGTARAGDVSAGVSNGPWADEDAFTGHVASLIPISHSVRPASRARPSTRPQTPGKQTAPRPAAPNSSSSLNAEPSVSILTAASARPRVTPASLGSPRKAASGYALSTSASRAKVASRPTSPVKKTAGAAPGMTRCVGTSGNASLGGMAASLAGTSGRRPLGTVTNTPPGSRTVSPMASSQSLKQLAWLTRDDPPTVWSDIRDVAPVLKGARSLFGWKAKVKVEEEAVVVKTPKMPVGRPAETLRLPPWPHAGASPATDTSAHAAFSARLIADAPSQSTQTLPHRAAALAALVPDTQPGTLLLRAFVGGLFASVAADRVHPARFARHGAQLLKQVLLVMARDGAGATHSAGLRYGGEVVRMATLVLMFAGEELLGGWGEAWRARGAADLALFGAEGVPLAISLWPATSLLHLAPEFALARAHAQACHDRLAALSTLAGELYCVGLLGPCHVRRILRRLLAAAHKDPNPRDIGTAVKLLTRVGLYMDHPGKRRRHVNSLFRRLETVANDWRTPPELRGDIARLAKLRKNGWRECGVCVG